MIEYVDEAASLIMWKDRRKIEKKVLPEYYKGIRTHKKMFEIRKDEDDIHPGDILVLREWDGEKYTGGMTRREVTAVLRDCPEYGLMDGYCILSLQVPGWDYVRPSTTLDAYQTTLFEESESVGKWIDGEPSVPDASYKKDNLAYYCSECHHRAGKFKHKTYKYCPWCGARMVE